MGTDPLCRRAERRQVQGHAVGAQHAHREVPCPPTLAARTRPARSAPLRAPSPSPHSVEHAVAPFAPRRRPWLEVATKIIAHQRPACDALVADGVHILGDAHHEYAMRVTLFWYARAARGLWSAGAAGAAAAAAARAIACETCVRARRRHTSPLDDAPPLCPPTPVRALEYGLEEFRTRYNAHNVPGPRGVARDRSCQRRRARAHSHHTTRPRPPPCVSAPRAASQVACPTTVASIATSVRRRRALRRSSTAALIGPPVGSPQARHVPTTISSTISSRLTPRSWSSSFARVGGGSPPRRMHGRT